MCSAVDGVSATSSGGDQAAETNRRSLPNLQGKPSHFTLPNLKYFKRKECLKIDYNLQNFNTCRANLKCNPLWARGMSAMFEYACGDGYEKYLKVCIYTAYFYYLVFEIENELF